MISTYISYMFFSNRIHVIEIAI